MFVVNAPGGFGKTFTFKLITAKIRSEGGIVLSVASTGKLFEIKEIFMIT